MKDNKGQNRNRRQNNESISCKPDKISAISKILDLPQNVFVNIPQIELSSNREAVIEGCQGVLEYDENVIKLANGNMVIKFCGRNLQIKCMSSNNLIIEGYIGSIEFLT